jgi:ATP-dependent Clp protease adaptor protein ClpS
MNQFSPELVTTVTAQPIATRRWRAILYTGRRHQFDDIAFWLESMTNCTTDFAYEICNVCREHGRAVCYQGNRAECHDLVAKLRAKGLQVEVDDY